MGPSSTTITYPPSNTGPSPGTTNNITSNNPPSQKTDTEFVNGARNKDPNTRLSKAPPQVQKIPNRFYITIQEDIKEELRKGNYKVNIAPSDLVDFGGQKSFDMTHQLFI
jgi:hypothetical protein